MFRKKEEVFTVKEFLSGESEKDKYDKRVLHALLFLNPFLTPEMASSQYNQIVAYTSAPKPYTPYTPGTPPATPPVAPYAPSDPGFIEGISGAVNGVKDLVYYLTNPVEILKIFASVTIDLSFTIAAIACIVSLSMFVFTGCKDKSSLKYCGLSLILYFVVVTIFTQFIALF